MLFINDFRKYVVSFKEKFIKVILPDDKINKVHSFVSEIIRVKKEERGYRFDGKKLYKRFLTGMLGEVGIEQLIKKNFVNWSVGHSSKYNIADLSSLNLNIGIKTVEYGKFPIVHKNPVRPEIINFKKSDNEILVCGLATRDILKFYQSDNYILSPFLRKKGTKTAFYGFSDMISFNNYKSLLDAYYTDIFLQKIAV